MGEILGLGLTHFPPLAWPDEMMDRALQFALADPAVPDAVKAGEGWPAGMREEYDRDRVTAAGGHRAALVAGCERVRSAARRVRAGRRGHLGRRPVRAVPRGRRACVLRDRRRRADVPALALAVGRGGSERVGRADRHVVPRARQRTVRPRARLGAARRRRRRRICLRAARRLAVPACDRQHGAVPRLRAARLPARHRADDRELLRTAGDRPPRRDGPLRPRRGGPAARPAEPVAATLRRGRTCCRSRLRRRATCGSR